MKPKRHNLRRWKDRALTQKIKLAELYWKIDAVLGDDRSDIRRAAGDALNAATALLNKLEVELSL